MTKKNINWSGHDVREWFKRLDRFNAVEPSIFEREQPDPQKREIFDQSTKVKQSDL